MEIGKKLNVTGRSEWRRWLSKNHDKKKDIWLYIYKKNSKIKGISYEEAVMEALCYGWIDSITKRVDENRFIQRFSPRKKTSILSPYNKARLDKLIKDGKMTKAGLDAVNHVYITEKS